MEAAGTPPCAQCGQPIYPGEVDQAMTKSMDGKATEMVIVHAACADAFRESHPMNQD